MDIAEEMRRETAQQASQAGASSGGSALPAHLDITDTDGVKTVLGEAIQTYGPIHALVNCVGGGKPLPSLEIEEADLNQMFEFNLKSTYRTCWAVLPHMTQRGSGKIVNFSADILDFEGICQSDAECELLKHM